MEENQNSVKKDHFLPYSILAAAILISGSVIYSAGLKNVQKEVVNPEKNNDSETVIVDLADDDTILGRASAPVTIVEFGDYQCPFCGRFFKQFEPKLREDYIVSGKAKFVYRDFAFLGEESKIAALAAECAGDQGKYWEYHDKLFEVEIADSAENNGNLSPQLMKNLAVQLGLDSNAFNLCLDSQKYLAEIEKDYDDGVKAGVRGTPYVFINGELMPGLKSYADYQGTIDKFLSTQ